MFMRVIQQCDSRTDRSDLICTMYGKIFFSKKLNICYDLF